MGGQYGVLLKWFKWRIGRWLCEEEEKCVGVTKRVLGCHIHHTMSHVVKGDVVIES